MTKLLIYCLLITITNIIIACLNSEVLNLKNIIMEMELTKMI